MGLRNCMPSLASQTAPNAAFRLCACANYPAPPSRATLALTHLISSRPTNRIDFYTTV